MARYALLLEAGTLVLALSTHPDARYMSVEEDDDLEALRENAKDLMRDDPFDQYYPGGLVDLVRGREPVVTHTMDVFCGAGAPKVALPA
jgi:hypothetical protein